MNTEGDFELGTDGPSTILVGVDGSDSSWRALHYAVGLARRQKSRILAVHAHHTPALAYGALAAQVPVALPDIDPDDSRVRKLAARVAALAREHGVEFSVCSVQGEPAAALTAVAERHHVDLIVVGASQQRGHRYFGSTGRRIIATGEYPVTVVP